MNLIEMKAAGYNKYVIQKHVRCNWSKDQSRITRGRRWADLPTAEAVRRAIKEHCGKNFAAFSALTRGGRFSITARVMPAIYQAYVARSKKQWSLPVWHNESWSRNASFTEMHYCHVSSEDPTKVAYTPKDDKLLRDVQVRMKPGRYLMQFFGPGSDNPVLSEAECKAWADRQIAGTAPAELKLVPNTDPDGWVWVYENSAPSCMRYNRSGRFLEMGLHGDDHPVRCYANPENDLALAYIMSHGTVEDRGTDCDKDEWVVAARTIVNTEDKTWLRIYAESDTDRAKLEALLSANDYEQSSNTLDCQRLQRLEYNGSLICPYLDGDVTNIDDRGDCLVVRCNGDYDGQNSCGVISVNACSCPRCGDAIASDEYLTYVECRGESICSYCLDDYTLACVNRHCYEYISNDDVIEIDGEYYSKVGAEAHGFVQCENGDWHREEYTVELDDGDVVHIDDAAEDSINETWHLRDEMVDSIDGLIYSGNAVDAYGSVKAHVHRCYALRIDDRTVYVHRNFLEDLANSSHFARLGDTLILANSGLGVPIVTAFKPTNVVDGEHTNNRGANCLDDWELPDEDEFVGPLVPIHVNFNSNVLYMEAA